MDFLHFTNYLLINPSKPPVDKPKSVGSRWSLWLSVLSRYTRVYLNNSSTIWKEHTRPVCHKLVVGSDIQHLITYFHNYKLKGKIRTQMISYSPPRALQHWIVGIQHPTTSNLGFCSGTWRGTLGCVYTVQFLLVPGVGFCGKANMYCKMWRSTGWG